MMRDRRQATIAVFTLTAFLLLTALLHGSHTPSTAPWAYRGHPKHNDITPKQDEDSKTKRPHPKSALEDSDDEDVPHGRWAFATFLEVKEDDGRDDQYFTAARTLTYQLLHHPKTRTKHNIPLVVLAPPHIGKTKTDILTDEGAKVIRVEPMGIEKDWIPGTGIRASVEYAKLRVFERTEYERVLYLDSATLLTRRIDDIWDEEMVRSSMRTLSKIEAASVEKGEETPKSYFLLGSSDTGDAKHHFPPKETDWMTDGFFMLQPDKKLFHYYQKLLKKPDGKFDMNRFVAGLLNYAHRQDGPMPWKSFKPGKWSVNHPGTQDVEGKVATMYTKFWAEENRDWLNSKLIEMWWRTQGQMEGFWFRRGYGSPRTFD